MYAKAFSCRHFNVLCEMLLCGRKGKEMKSQLCEMKIFSLQNEIGTLQIENLFFL